VELPIQLRRNSNAKSAGEAGLRPQIARRFFPEAVVDLAERWFLNCYLAIVPDCGNWAGEPLDSYRKILDYARTTQTQTGLHVTAYLDRRHYPRGLKPSPDQIASLCALRARGPCCTSKDGSRHRWCWKMEPQLSAAALRTQLSLQDIARRLNPLLRGWIGYYGCYAPSALYPLLRYVDQTLVACARRKFKRFQRHTIPASQFLQRLAVQCRNLFVHWNMGITGSFA